MHMKIYKAHKTLFSTDVVVEKKSNGDKITRRITFGGGSRRPRRGGRFMTDEPELQKAIENDKSYGVKFTLEKDTTPKNKKANLGKQSKKTEESSSNNTDTYGDVKTVPEAKKVLTDMGAKPDEVKNSDAVLAKAEELGINFPNLKS